MSSECAVLAAFPINYWPCRYFPLYYWPGPVDNVEDYLVYSYFNLIELLDINMNTIYDINSGIETEESEVSAIDGTTLSIVSGIVATELNDSIIVLEENEDS